MKKIYLPAIAFFVCLFCVFTTQAQVKSLTENFDVVIPTGWQAFNHSTGADPDVDWFQGNPTAFPAHSGATNSYAGTNYQAIGDPPGVGTLNTWLVSPVLNFYDGGVVKFWTRIPAGANEYPDRLQLRLSTNGASVNVGSGPDDVGDFTTLLLTINPNLVTGVYPKAWKEYTVTLNEIPAGATGRIAFRYWVTDGGVSGNNSNYIGVDDFSYDGGLLSVNFLSFDGMVKDSKILLNWSTTNELSNKGFDIERSIDGNNFSAIGFVKGTGTTTGKNNYAYTDANKFLGGNIYYRLKQMDLDGTADYSSIIKVNVENKFNWDVYPNPISKNTSLQLQLDKNSKVTIQVVSPNGKIMQAVDKGLLSPGTYSVPLNLNNTAKGVYFVRMVVDGKTYTKTVVK